jgi:16S rRNA (guanine(966)-N(2))-methyltransferase RsmD
MARITGGTMRGRTLREPVPEGVRPTSERAREALFSIVGQDLTGSSVLDAFGGTGVLGLEALSRGADVTVVEQVRDVARGIERRGAAVGAAWTVRVGDVLRLAPSLGMFDGILADPPWDADAERIVTVLGPLAKAWMVLEIEGTTPSPAGAGQLVLDRERSYGRTKLCVYRVVSRDDRTGGSAP